MSIEADTPRTTMLTGMGPRGWVIVAVMALLAIGPYLANEAGHGFYLDLATRLICLAIAAVSLNLILGYGGMISFGHAAYIGLGAYCVGIPAYYEYTSGFLQFPLAIGVLCPVRADHGRLVPAHQGRLFHHDHHGVFADGVLPVRQPG